MAKVLLHGGGDAPDSFQPFVETCKRIAMIILQENEADIPAYHTILSRAGAQMFNLNTFVVAPAQPLDFDELHAFRPNGIFVCGGITPHYHAALCQNAELTHYIRENNLHYCGTSAGAAIACQTAVVGGWRVRRGDITRQILFQGASEGLDMLTLKPGLGLVPFSVDVHAAQWGTLLRLIHAVETGETRLGYAVDENTMLIVDSGRMRVHGEGQVYRVQSAEKHRIEVAILLP